LGALPHAPLRRIIAVHHESSTRAELRLGTFDFQWLLRCVGNDFGSLNGSQKGVELSAKNPMYLTGLAAAFAADGQREKALETLDAIGEMAATLYVSPLCSPPLIAV
jgi:hypothetical protein